MDRLILFRTESRLIFCLISSNFDFVLIWASWITKCCSNVRIWGQDEKDPISWNVKGALCYTWNIPVNQIINYTKTISEYNEYSHYCKDEQKRNKLRWPTWRRRIQSGTILHKLTQFCLVDRNSCCSCSTRKLGRHSFEVSSSVIVRLVGKVTGIWRHRKSVQTVLRFCWAWSNCFSL